LSGPRSPSARQSADDERRLAIVEWVLRIAVAGEFAGHGAFALGVKESWIPFITLFGFSEEAARQIMPWVGVLDISLAASILVRPLQGAVAWMAFWGFFTALLRPLSGMSILEFVERGANWGAPLALLWVLRARRHL
jgi:hypothetical protein